MLIVKRFHLYKLRSRAVFMSLKTHYDPVTQSDCMAFSFADRFIMSKHKAIGGRIDNSNEFYHIKVRDRWLGH